MTGGLINIFEDVNGIRDGCWLKLIRNGDIVPDEYGVAWYQPNAAIGVCAPMPFHTLLGWAYRAYWWWRVRWGCRSSTLYQRAFLEGLEQQRAISHGHLTHVLEEHVKVVASAKALAYAEGRAYGRGEVLDALRHVAEDERMN